MSSAAMHAVGNDGMTQEAQAALHGSSIYALRRIDINRVDENQFILRGRVPTFYCKQQAQEVVRQTIRNAILINDIEVT